MGALGWLVRLHLPERSEWQMKPTSQPSATGLVLKTGFASYRAYTSRGALRLRDIARLHARRAENAGGTPSDRSRSATARSGAEQDSEAY